MTGQGAGSARVPQSLRELGLQPLWAALRSHLDRRGSDSRGSIRRPDLDPSSELVLRSLLGQANKNLDLSHLEAALIERRVGDDLSDALSQLGHPPSREAAQRREVRARSAAARAALRDATESWPEPWAHQWAEGVIGAGLHGGLDPGDVETLVHSVRRLLDYANEHAAPPHPGPPPEDGTGPSDYPDSRPDDRPDRVEPENLAVSPFASRTDLAARLFGSAHALDPGTRLAALVSRALRWRVGENLEGRELWEKAGIQADRVSAPALSWAVPATGSSVVAELLRTASGNGLPLHLSLLAMQREPVAVPAGTRVLVVENPRLVEAAAERRLECCVVAANGNPSTAVTTLLDQMRRSGASVWYHGDFDAAGIAICRRMHDSGCWPWMMSASDYREAIQSAERNGVRLDEDSKVCGPTPWDPRLEAAFNDQRLIIHEEFVLDEVLSGFAHMVANVGS